jgi:hypothetical protein
LDAAPATLGRDGIRYRTLSLLPPFTIPWHLAAGLLRFATFLGTAAFHQPIFAIGSFPPPWPDSETGADSPTEVLLP